MQKKSAISLWRTRRRKSSCVLRENGLSRSSVTERLAACPRAQRQPFKILTSARLHTAIPVCRGMVREPNQGCCGTPCANYKRDVAMTCAGAGSGSRRPADNRPLTDLRCSVSASSLKKVLKADRMTPASLNRGCLDPSMSKDSRLRDSGHGFALAGEAMPSNSHSPSFRRQQRSKARKRAQNETHSRKSKGRTLIHTRSSKQGRLVSYHYGGFGALVRIVTDRKGNFGLQKRVHNSMCGRVVRLEYN
jgi:hypothetical protein